MIEISDFDYSLIIATIIALFVVLTILGVIAILIDYGKTTGVLCLLIAGLLFMSFCVGCYLPSLTMENELIFVEKNDIELLYVVLETKGESQYLHLYGKNDNITYFTKKAIAEKTRVEFAENDGEIGVFEYKQVIRKYLLDFVVITDENPLYVVKINESQFRSETFVSL